MIKLIEALLKENLEIINIRDTDNSIIEFDFCFHPVNKLKNKSIYFSHKYAYEEDIAYNFLLGQLYIFIEMIHQWIEEEGIKKMAFDLVWELTPEITENGTIDCKFYLIEYKK